MNKTLIKIYYKKGIYTKSNLDIFVRAGYITLKDKREIIDDG